LIIWELDVYRDFERRVTPMEILLSDANCIGMEIHCQFPTDKQALAGELW
jgi:hypothetical protein